MAERSYNKVVLLGRLGQDAEMRYTPSGKAVTTINMATSRSWKNTEGELQTKTTWVRVEMWSALAEVANQYLKKGARVLIDGRLEIDRVDATDDQPAKFYTKVVANEMVMLGNAVDPNAEPEEETGDIVFN